MEIKNEAVGADVYHLVKKHFPALNEKKLIDEIGEIGQFANFKAGEMIMDFGAYVKWVPLLIEGSIKVVREDKNRDQELFLYFLKPGETCSMSFSCCMMHKKSDIRTTAEDDSTLIGIPVKYVDEWMMKYPSWKNFVMQTYDARMHELIQTIDSIAFNKLDERLLKYLQQKATAIQATTIHTTHQDIAHDMNASREAISRLLKKLEKEQHIKLGRNKIELL